MKPSLAEQEGRLAEALTFYEKSGGDPEAHRAAASLARRLGRTEEARRHFEAAERSCRRILDAGEIYSLESLARLYLDAGVNLEEAKALARRNLEFKRDRSAVELARDLSVPVPAAEARPAGASPPSLRFHRKPALSSL